MNEQQKKFLNITIWVFAICLLLRLLISGQEIAVNLKSDILALVYSAIGYIGEAISVTAIIMAILKKQHGGGHYYLRFIMFQFYLRIM